MGVLLKKFDNPNEIMLILFHVHFIQYQRFKFPNINIIVALIRLQNHRAFVISFVPCLFERRMRGAAKMPHLFSLAGESMPSLRL